MKVEWQEYLAVGIEEIDLQHMLLFDKFNNLLAACEQGSGAEEVNRLFTFLGAYVLIHFSDEERLMQRLGFPDFQKHRDLHQAFTLQIARLKEQLVNEGPTQSLVSTACLTINGWLIEHISVMDRALGRFAKEKKGKIT
jgi:hemerythrin